MQFCEQLLETVEVGFTAKWSSWSKQNCVYRGTRFFTMLLKMFFLIWHMMENRQVES